MALCVWRHRNVCSTAPAAPLMRLPIPNPNPNPNPNPKTHPNPNPIFNPNPSSSSSSSTTMDAGENPNPYIITYFPKGQGWVYKWPISRTWSFSYWVHVFLWRHTHSVMRSQDARVLVLSRFQAVQDVQIWMKYTCRKVYFIHICEDLRTGAIVKNSGIL